MIKGYCNGDRLVFNHIYNIRLAQNDWGFVEIMSCHMKKNKKKIILTSLHAMCIYQAITQPAFHKQKGLCGFALACWVYLQWSKDISMTDALIQSAE